MIPWRPIAEMPEALKDGREVLIATPDRLGTAYGGDGVKLHPERPYTIELASWANGRWEVYAGHDTDYTDADDVAYFAEVTRPDPDAITIEVAPGIDWTKPIPS